MSFLVELKVFKKALLRIIAVPEPMKESTTGSSLDHLFEALLLWGEGGLSIICS